MEPGFGKYKVRVELGQGKFGKVFLVNRVDDETAVFAAKKVSKQIILSNPRLKELFESEVSIMRTIEHPHILHLHDFCETDTDYYMVTEFCPDGDLEKYIQKNSKLQESEAIFYLKQIMSGFVELHMKRVMHRDFKPANIYLNNGHIVIGDFGLAKVGHSTTTSKMGTPLYMAPEILFSKHEMAYTSKCDLFSIGVVYFYMLFGSLPFEGTDLNRLEQDIELHSGQNLRFPTGVQVSAESQQLLRSLLEKDPVDRLSWNQFFNHNLFKIENLNHYIYGLRESFMIGGEVLSPRKVTINSSFGSGSEQSLLINYRFEEERRRIALIGDVDIFDNNQPGQNHQPVDDSYTNTEVPKTELQAFSNFYRHESNIRMFVMDSAMQAKRLFKESNSNPDLRGEILLASYLLALKGLKLCTQLTLSLYYRHNLIMLDHFDRIVMSSLGQKLLSYLRKDESDSKKYFDRLAEILACECREKQVEHPPIVHDMKITSELSTKDIDYLLKQLQLSFANHYKLNICGLHKESSRRDSVVRLIGTIEYCLKIERNFPFRLADGSEFSWEAFRQRDAIFLADCHNILAESLRDIDLQNQNCSKQCSRLNFFCN